MQLDNLKSDERYLGIKYVKLFAGIIMIFNHAIIWYAVNKRYYYDLSNFDFSVYWIIFVGMCSLAIPATAGAIFRLTLNKYIYNGTLYNFPMTILWKIVAFLMIFESLKNFLMWGYQYIFSWNVLHFVALSFCIIVFTLKINIVYTCVLSCIVFFATPFLKEFLSRQLLYFDDINKNYISLVYVAICCVLIVGLFLLPFLNYLLKNIHKKYESCFSLISLTQCKYFFIAIFFAILITAVLALNPANSLFWARIYNLPFAVLIGDKSAYHIWPLFPWFAIVAYGFCLMHIYIVTANKSFVRFGKVVVLLLGVSVFWKQILQEYYLALSSVSLWSSAIFAPKYEVVLGVLIVFTSLCLIADLFYSFLEKISFLRPLSNMSLLWIYFISSFFSYYFAKIFPAYFASPATNAIAFAIVMIIFTVLVIMMIAKYLDVFFNKLIKKKK